MQYSEVSDLPIISEDDAAGEVANIYEQYKREMQTPYIPNIMKVLAISPSALAFHWDFLKSLSKNGTLPEALRYMILYTIAAYKDSRYCSAGNELTCRTLGIDEATIRTLVEDVDSITPHRIRQIIKFALQVALDPQGLTEEDYTRVRDSGISDEEMVEIIQLAAISNYMNTMSDALRVPIEQIVSTALRS
jgi:uncharacterized peroxidase-related enzyme